MRAAGRPKPDLPDAEAVARARSGDHEAFRVLVERYQARAYQLALRILRDPEQARDAVQEGFLKAYQSLGRFEGRSNFYTWLYRLMFNLCIDMKRRDHADRHMMWDDETAREIAPSPLSASRALGTPEDAAARGALREAVLRAVAALPDDARRTLLLREVDGLGYAEIAKALGIPKGTVMSRLHHARRRVRQMLIEAGALEEYPPVMREEGSK
jgi:RNA polymerase sigma-70 factor, ECF subfamily